ncbi:glycosyltransferase [Neptunicella marina]|uniref:Glycosyltransferase n=1 Tax=Neptunicella marina TaxID=2125989 RepID=A0A8J6IS95_9ALTE|nr:glycosyltransferase [Neptunicella marina]MBC3764927.1 glycosyltransferase [Neptunicella marina]
MITPKKSILFHRWYHGYTGGHQKVCDYLHHIQSTGLYDVNLWLENKAKTQTGLFSNLAGIKQVENYDPRDFDYIFLAGLDWNAYLPFKDNNQPVINLIQHVRHGNPKHPLFDFLQHRAIRICVSDAVKDAISPYANGPCFTIKMGHQFAKLKMPKNNDLYILGTKQPEMANEIGSWAENKGFSVITHSRPVERDLVYQSMAKSRVTIALPNKTEGFYLPGIEAMALSDWVVVPDCIANREYASNGANITLCEHSIEACKVSISKVFGELSFTRRMFFKYKGLQRVKSYDLSKERICVTSLMKDIDQIW